MQKNTKQNNLAFGLYLMKDSFCIWKLILDNLVCNSPKYIFSYNRDYKKS